MWEDQTIGVGQIMMTSTFGCSQFSGTSAVNFSIWFS